MSHVIYRGHFSRCPTNAAIPTMHIQCLNESSMNDVRNCWLTAIAGHQGNAPNNTSREGPTGAQGTGGTPGPGAHKTRGTTQQQPAPHSNTSLSPESYNPYTPRSPCIDGRPLTTAPRPKNTAPRPKNTGPRPKNTGTHDEALASSDTTRPGRGRRGRVPYSSSKAPV